MQHDTAKLEQVSASAQDPVPVRFAKNDPQDPAEGWSRWKRYRGAQRSSQVALARVLTLSLFSTRAGHVCHVLLGLQRVGACRQPLGSAADAEELTFAAPSPAQANGAASGGFREDHPGVTTNVFQASSFTYLAMLGIGPLVLAPVSETFGRRPQIVICTFMWVNCVCTLSTSSRESSSRRD